VARRKSDPLPNGVLDATRAADYFSFRVDSPRTVVLQADSMGLGFLLDPMVAIYDESGRRIAWQDEPTTCTGREPCNLDPPKFVEQKILAAESERLTAHC